MPRLLTITFTTAAFRTEAAYGSLKPPPARRLRRALLHLSYSMTFSRLLDTTTSHAGCHSARKQVSSELGPVITTPPRFRHRPYAFDISIVVPLRSSSCLPPDLVLARPFPSALTTMAFDHSR